MKKDICTTQENRAIRSAVQDYASGRRIRAQMYWPPSKACTGLKAARVINYLAASRCPSSSSHVEPEKRGKDMQMTTFPIC